MESGNNETVEIDVKELFSVLVRKLWLILLLGVMGAACAGAYSKYMLQPLYASSASVYIINRQEDNKMTFSDIQTGSSLTKDYMILVKSRPVTEEVINNLNLNMTADQLAGMIDVSSPPETRILRITVKNSDPELAKKLADALAEVSAKHMVSIMEMEKVNIIEQGSLPTAPFSPDIMNNTLLGGFAGGIVAVGLIIILFLINDSIKTTEDIEKHLNLTTLGTIPLIDSKIMKKRKKLRKKEAAKAG